VNATPTSLVPFGAGASIGFGVCLQPLSAPALLPLVFAGVARWRTHRSPRLQRFLAALAVSSIVFGTLCLRSDRLERYTTDLAFRGATPALSDLGLPALLSNHGVARYRFQRVDSAPDPAADWRNVRAPAHASKVVWHRTLLLLVALGASVIAWRRRSLEVGATLGLTLVALWMEPLGQNLGLLGVALLCSRRTELALPVLTALAGCVVLNNQTVFADDRSAGLTVLLWVSTLGVVSAWWPGRRKPWLGRANVSQSSPAIASEG